jgi:hypothetical protein
MRAHPKEPCAATVLATIYNGTEFVRVEVCTDPGRHLKAGASEAVKVEADPTKQRSDFARAEREYEKTERAKRYAAVTKLIGTAAGRKATQPLLEELAFHEVQENEGRWWAALVGIEPPQGEDGELVKWSHLEARRAVVEWAERSPLNHLKAACAALLFTTAHRGWSDLGLTLLRKQGGYRKGKAPERADYES